MNLKMPVLPTPQRDWQNRHNRYLSVMGENRVVYAHAESTAFKIPGFCIDIFELAHNFRLLCA